MQNIIFKRIKNTITEKTLNVWLRLVVLTLISAIVAETNNTTVIATIFVCIIVIIKGRWIIDEFMGLKLVAPFFRSMVICYLYVMTTIVGVIVAYSQISLA